MSSKAEITIIILNYNTPDWVENCLKNIKEYCLDVGLVKPEVIVVDNGSSDHSVFHVRKHFDWVKVIETKQNLGFAGGNNVALREVKTKYAMLLNSDTEFTPETHLERILSYMDQYPEVAVATPKLLLSNGKLDLASHRGEPTPWASLTYFSKLSKVFPHSPLFAQYHQTYKDFSSIHAIDACSGAAMVVRTSAMQEVGLLDEQFFMYAEDLDWCRRFRDKGYGVVYYPKTVIIHHKYKSGLKNADQKVAKKTNAHFYDTMLQYYDKHYRKTYPGFVREIIKFIIQLKKGAR
jgi:GT2 family glycosyltransferase